MKHVCLGLDEWKLSWDHIVLKLFSAVAPSASLCNRLHVSVCQRGRFDACRGVVTVTTKGRTPPGFVRLCRLSGRCGSMCFWDSYWTSTAQNICSVLRPNEKTTNTVKQPWGLIYPEFNQPLTPSQHVQRGILRHSRMFSSVSGKIFKTMQMFNV